MNQPMPVPQPTPMHRRPGRRGVSMSRLVDAVMPVEELVRHQRLVGDVGMADQRRGGPGAEIQLGPHARRSRTAARRSCRTGRPPCWGGHAWRGGHAQPQTAHVSGGNGPTGKILSCQICSSSFIRREKAPLDAAAGPSQPISAGGGLSGESLYAAWEKAPQSAGNSGKAVWDRAGRTAIIGQVCVTTPCAVGRSQRPGVATGCHLAHGVCLLPCNCLQEEHQD